MNKPYYKADKMKESILDKIKERWNENNFQECSENIDRLKFSATTGSEIVNLIGSYLMDLKRENGEKYKVAKYEINRFFRQY